MCGLCVSHRQKIKQFHRALTQPLDELSKNRIAEALKDIEATKPACADVNSAESKIVHLQLHRIVTALDALSHPEIENLVKEIEGELDRGNLKALSDPNALPE